MGKKKNGMNTSKEAAELRRRAEERLEDQTSHPNDYGTDIDKLRLIHELKVHQVELEMQNEELLRSRLEVETGLERYTDLYDFAPVGYFTLTRDGSIRQVNLSGATLLGVERSRLVGMRFGIFVSESDRTVFNEFLARVFADRAKESCEGVFLKEEKQVFVRLEGVVFKEGAECRVAVMDITEHKRIEEAQLFLLRCGYLNPGEDFFKSLAKYLAESLGMDFVCIDRLEGDGMTARMVAVYSDGKYEDNVTYGLKDTPCGEVVGKTICCYPRDVGKLFPRDAVLQEMKAESYLGITLWSFDGKPIGLIAVIGRQPLEKPRLAEYVLKMVAIRAAGELERRAVEEALQKVHGELEIRVHDRTAELKQAVLELQRSNQDLEQFAYVSSHDLQEPLRMVSAYCGLLEKNYADKLDPDAREYIGFAVEGAKRMQQLIKNLLDYSRVNTRSKPFGSVNCGEVFNHVLWNLSMVISETKAQVTCDSLPTVWGDDSQIMQVFQNLIENALKFRKGQEPPVIHVSAGSNGREWVFNVRDKGIGIDSQHHSRIFVIFQRLHARSLYPGTGIGLTIVKRIVERHGGQICIESVPGEGSNFIFTLPDAGGFVS